MKVAFDQGVFPNTKFLDRMEKMRMVFIVS